MFVRANNDLVLLSERCDLTQIIRLQEGQIDWQDQERARAVCVQFPGTLGYGVIETAAIGLADRVYAELSCQSERVVRFGYDHGPLNTGKFRSNFYCTPKKTFIQVAPLKMTQERSKPAFPAQ
jgi:hypothetical protein